MIRLLVLINFESAESIKHLHIGPVTVASVKMLYDIFRMCQNDYQLDVVL